MVEAVAQFATRSQAFGPTDDQRIANAAAMGVLLVALERRIGRRRPAPGEVAVGVGPADVVDARQLGGQGLGLLVVWPHRIDEAQRPALLAGAVVRQHHDDGVVELAAGLEKIHQPGDLPVELVQHRRISRLQPRHQRAQGRGMAVPRLNAGVGWRQDSARRHDAQFDLACQTAGFFLVPAVLEQRVITFDQRVRRLVWRMAGAWCQPQMPGLVGLVGRMVGQVAQRLIHQVHAQVVAGLEVAGRGNLRVVAHQLGRVLVGLGVHETVEAVIAPAQRPAVERAGRAGLGQRGDMPFADHVVGIALRAQHLGQRRSLGRDLAAVTGVSRVEVGQAAHAHPVVVAAGHQRGAGGRAHRRGVKTRQAQTPRSQRVDGRGADRRAVTAEIGKAHIIEQHDQHVGLLGRAVDARRPPRRGLRNRLADLAGKVRHLVTLGVLRWLDAKQSGRLALPPG